jgi:hypothetical protein
MQLEGYKSDKLLELSNKYWAPHAKKHADFNAEVIEDIYGNELAGDPVTIRRKVMLLEFSQVSLGGVKCNDFVNLKLSI